MDIFCKIINGDIPSYTIYEDDLVKVILDVNPKSKGHSLIIPKEHYKDLYDIPSNILCHIMEVSKKISELLNDKFNSLGITLMQNNGIAQDVKHFHLHVIPVYKEEDNVDIEEVYKKIMH